MEGEMEGRCGEMRGDAWSARDYIDARLQRANLRPRVYTADEQAGGERRRSEVRTELDDALVHL